MKRYGERLITVGAHSLLLQAFMWAGENGMGKSTEQERAAVHDRRPTARCLMLDMGRRMQRLACGYGSGQVEPLAESTGFEMGRFSGTAVFSLSPTRAETLRARHVGTADGRRALRRV